MPGKEEEKGNQAWKQERTPGPRFKGGKEARVRWERKTERKGMRTLKKIEQMIADERDYDPKRTEGGILVRRSIIESGACHNAMQLNDAMSPESLSPPSSRADCTYFGSGRQTHP